MGMLQTIMMTMGLDAKPFGKELKTVESVAKKMSDNIKKLFAFAGIGLGLAGLRDLFKDVEAISARAATVAMPIGKYQQLVEVFRLMGANSEQAYDAIRQFSKIVGDAASGIGVAAEMFDQFGISVFNANGSAKDQIEILGEIAEKMQKLPSALQQNTMMFKTMGETGTIFVQSLRKGKDEFKIIVDEANKMSKVSQEDANRVRESWINIEGVFIRVKNSIVVFISNIIDGFKTVRDFFTNEDFANQIELKVEKAFHGMFASIKLVYADIQDATTKAWNVVTVVISKAIEMAIDRVKVNFQGLALHFESIVTKIEQGFAYIATKNPFSSAEEKKKAEDNLSWIESKIENIGLKIEANRNTTSKSWSEYLEEGKKSIEEVESYRDKALKQNEQTLAELNYKLSQYNENQKKAEEEINYQKKVSKNEEYLILVAKQKAADEAKYQAILERERAGATGEVLNQEKAITAEKQKQKTQSSAGVFYTDKDGNQVGIKTLPSFNKFKDDLKGASDKDIQSIMMQLSGQLERQESYWRQLGSAGSISGGMNPIEVINSMQKSMLNLAEDELKIRDRIRREFEMGTKISETTGKEFDMDRFYQRMYDLYKLLPNQVDELLNGIDEDKKERKKTNELLERIDLNLQNNLRVR